MHGQIGQAICKALQAGLGASVRLKGMNESHAGVEVSRIIANICADIEEGSRWRHDSCKERFSAKIHICVRRKNL